MFKRHQELIYCLQNVLLYPNELNKDEIDTIKLVALLCSLVLLSARASRTFVKVPAFLFIKGHKKQEKVSTWWSAVV